ncbi:hypothetical protein DM267_26290, partial [Escherichia coli]|nr:hypothetical protein [Escherichia coli]
THANGKITLCVEQVFKKVVGENHCGNPLVTDVRRPPATRCRKGPEQELMEFVLLPDELLKPDVVSGSWRCSCSDFPQ